MMNHRHKITKNLVSILLIPPLLVSTVADVAWGGGPKNANDALKVYMTLLPADSKGIAVFSEAINCFALALELTRMDLGDPSGDLPTYIDKCRFDIKGENVADANGAIQQGLLNLTGALIWALAENLRRHKTPRKPLPGSVGEEE